MAKEKTAYKKGVSHSLLDKCAGTDLDKRRIIRRDSESRIDRLVYATDGTTMEVDEWKKDLKKARKHLKA